jgi:hypothetical protein
MKQGFKIFIGVVAVLAVVVSFFFLVGSSKLLSLNNSPPAFSASLVQQSVVGGTVSDGNSYYEERCIDITQYLSQGYVKSSVDSHGCQLVQKQFVSATVSIGNFPNGCSNGCCHGSNSVPSNSYCTSRLGGDWTATCDSRLPTDNSYKNVNCVQYSYDVKGGFEQVLNTCSFAQNDLLVGESFAGGQSITKASLRYPIKSFCRAHPSIITDDVLKSSITSTNVPQDLIDGKTVTIGASQTLTVFYVIENNFNLPTICDSSKNLALDVNNSAVCKSTLGFTYLCSQGQFDALTGTCVVQPESQTLCAQGRYDVQKNLCIYNPPVQVDCGSNDCFYSVDRNICSCYVASQDTCPSGYTLHKPSQSECVENNDTWLLCPQCPVDKVCSSDICVASCDKGTVCTFESPSHIVCDNANATIHADGTCTINGTTITVCPQGQTYNDVTNNCELKPDSVDVCSDGSQPQVNVLTGVKECVRTPQSYLDCGENLTFSNGKCVYSVEVYNPVNQTFIQYQEVYKGCTADSECNGITAGLTCNTPSGYCQTPIVVQKPDYTGIIITIIIAVIVIAIIFIMSRTKRGRRK